MAVGGGGGGGGKIMIGIADNSVIIGTDENTRHRVYDAFPNSLYDSTTPGLVAPENLGDSTTYLRNPNIARLARKVGLVEKLGTGIGLIKQSCRKKGLQPPVFIEGTDNFTVILSCVKNKQQAKPELDEL